LVLSFQLRARGGARPPEIKGPGDKDIKGSFYESRLSRLFETVIAEYQNR